MPYEKDPLDVITDLECMLSGLLGYMETVAASPEAFNHQIDEATKFSKAPDILSWWTEHHTRRDVLRYENIAATFLSQYSFDAQAIIKDAIRRTP